MPFDGNRLRATRKTMREHGRPVSQQRFAALAGYSKRTQERYETGKSEPRMTHLHEIVRLTGEPQDFFYGGLSASELAERSQGDDEAEAASMAPLAADTTATLAAALEAAFNAAIARATLPQAALESAPEKDPA